MKPKQLGRMQLQIMQILWEKRRATAREITEALAESQNVAHSTVQTVLRGLEDKQAIAHETEGRTFVFYPRVEEKNYRSSATRDLVERVFGGNVGELVTHLLENEKVAARELDEIRQMIDRRTNES